MYDIKAGKRLAEAAHKALEGVTPGELLPCPFCGGDAERVDIPEASSENDLAGNPNAGGSFIRCVSCDACTTLEFGRKESLESRWNDRFRSGVPALADGLVLALAEIERLREALGLAKREIRATVEQATGIMNDMGRGCDPAERTYGPIIARIDALLGGDHDRG